MRTRHGDPGGAAEASDASFAIARKLAVADPADARWQWHLVHSLWRLADLAQQRGDVETAPDDWQEVVRTAHDPAATGRLAAAEAKWLPELARRLAAARAKN